MEKNGPVFRVMSPMLTDLLANWRHAMGKTDKIKNPLSRFVRHADNMIVMHKDDDVYRYVHYGKTLAGNFDQELSGSTADLLPIDALPADRRALLCAEYDIVKRTGSPLWRSYSAAIVRGRLEAWQRLVLPVGGGKLVAAAYPANIPMEDDHDDQGATLLRMILERVPVVLDAEGRVIDLALSSKAYSDLYGDLDEDGSVLGEASHDAMTGVCSVRHFERLSMLELRHAQRMGRSFSVLLIDLDDFSKINGAFGRSVGDDAIKMLVGALKKTVRDFDIVGRVGGEEFAIGLVNADAKSAERVCDRLHSLVKKEKMLLSDGREVKVTISIGAVSTTTNQKKDTSINLPGLTDLLARAQIALHHAKAEGGDRIIVG